MDAPRCLVCDTKHWSRQPCPATSRETKLEHARDVLRQAEAVTKPIPARYETPVTIPPQNVTKPPPVTKPATGFVTPAAPSKGGRPRLGDHPMTAERMRRYRAHKTK
jgi:hypothetical protein